MNKAARQTNDGSDASRPEHVYNQWQCLIMGAYSSSFRSLQLMIHLNQKVGGNKHSIPFFALPLLKLKICVGRCELFAFFMVAQESIPKCSNSPFNTK